MVGYVWVPLFLRLLFPLHQFLDSLLYLPASVTHFLHAYFNFLLAKWVLSFPRTRNLPLWLPSVDSWSNVINRIVPTHSGGTTIWYVALYIDVGVVSRKLTGFMSRLALLNLRRPSHQCVFQIVFVSILSCLRTQDWGNLVPPEVLRRISPPVFPFQTVLVVIFGAW